MLDLNELPESAPDQLVEADNFIVKTAIPDAGVKASKIPYHDALPPVLGDHDEASTITVEEKPAELLHSRSSLSSTLTSDYSLARQHCRSSHLHEDGDTGKGCEDGLTANLLDQQEHPQPQVVLPAKIDLGDDALDAVYQFLSGSTTISLINGRSCAEASTSRLHEDKHDADPQTSTAFSLHKKTGNHDCKLEHDHGSASSKDGSTVYLSLGGNSCDGSAVRLSLSGVALQLQALNNQNSPNSGNICKRNEVFGLTLGRSDNRTALSTRRNTELFPFWNGKLRTDGPLLTPVDAYCLGVMKMDSCLKKLPSVLFSQQFLKLDEFMKSLRNGVAEPPAQFKPSKDASSEEVDRFNLMVEALSHGSGLSYSASLLGLDLGKKKVSADGTFPYSAALISWEEDANYKLDAKLYLISSQCFQELVKNGQSPISLGAFEETDTFDPDSLYGVFCSNPPEHLKDKNQATDLDAGRNKAVIISRRRLESSLSKPSSLSERTKETMRSPSPCLPRGSIRHHSGHSDALITSTPIDTRRVSNRDSILRSDIESPGRSSKRHLEKRASSTDNTRNVRSKHSSRQNDDSHDDEIDVHTHQKLRSRLKEKSSWTLGRHSERLEWRSDKDNERNKESSRCKEDRNSGKDRIREHHRNPHHERGKGLILKTKEERRSHERLSHKERDRSSRDKVTESLKMKLAEKVSSESKSSLVSHKVPSLDPEFGKHNRKRERDDRENNISSKRSLESEATVLASVNQPTGKASRDLKSGEVSKKIDQEECLVPKCLEQADRSFSHELDKDFLHLSKSSVSTPLSDGTSGGKDKTLVFVKEESAKLPVTHINFESIIEMNQDAVDAPVCETEGVSEVEFSLLKPTMMETSWNDGLGDSSLMRTTTEEGPKASLEVSLDVPIDKETRTWLMSKQNALYLHEEYGVDAEIISTGMEGSKVDTGVRTDGQNGFLQVKLSMGTSESCDAAEAKWFVEQAARIMKAIAIRGVYVKCLWYEGPIQIHPGDGAPAVPTIVKKIKGEDGKNLERMQDETGVMIGVVLRKSGVSFVNETEPMSRPRFIGLRLKCIRRRGLLEASKEVEALLECVAEHFSKELATHIATHIADLQESALHCCEVGANNHSLNLALSTKELLPHSPVKADNCMRKPNPGSSAVADDPGLLGDKGNLKLLDAASFTEELKVSSSLDLEGPSRLMYVSNLPDPITSSKVRNIIESVIREKLGSSGEMAFTSEPVVDVNYKPEKGCAFVELGSDCLLKAALKLYADDKTAFHGLCVEDGFLPLIRVERQGSCSRVFTKNRVECSRSISLPRSTDNEFGMLQLRTADNESDSDFSQDVWYADNAMRPDYIPEKPRPLYLTELMRNASGSVIKQLFETVINTYIGPSLANANGKQLVLDVRYVPTRGCAFVDLATRELVEFMLDLHSRTPEVFLNMKMELGRKAVPYPTEDDGERKLSLRCRDGKSQYGYRLSSSGYRKKLEKRVSYIDYVDDSDKGDELLRQNLRLKKQRSDPEKTIYADRLPESASENMIKRIFERVLLQNLTREERDAIGDHLISEVRYVPMKYCAFIVFANEDLTRLVLELYNQDEDVFECMRLKPHFHSRLEDLYKEDPQETDEVVRHTASVKERMASNDVDEVLRLRESEPHDLRSSRLAVQRAISATAFKEVDRRRSVYVDRIPEDLNELSMTQLFEKVFRHKKHGYDGRMVSQVAYFRDKFDPSKLCAFVEIKTEEGTQHLVDYYNDNQDAFHGMRVRPGFKYSN